MLQFIYKSNLYRNWIFRTEYFFPDTENETHWSNSSSAGNLTGGEPYLIVIGTALRTNKHYYKVWAKEFLVLMKVSGPSLLSTDCSFQIYMIYMNMALNGLLPLFSLVILNSLIYSRLRSSTAKRAPPHFLSFFFFINIKLRCLIFWFMILLCLIILIRMVHYIYRLTLFPRMHIAQTKLC